MRVSEGAAVYTDEIPSAPNASGANDVTREGRPTDASKLTFPVQMWLGAIIMTTVILGAMYRWLDGVSGNLSALSARIAAIENVRKVEQDNLDLRFKLLEEQIKNSELRKSLLDQLRSTPQ